MPRGADFVGSSIRQYHVRERLGAGGMGEVYLADDTRLGREVALKFLAATSHTSPEARARLVREAQLAAQLRSPHIAVAYDLVEDGDSLFIAMEYVEGELLSARLARGALSVPESLEIASQVADALDEAHSHAIIHRDIKSANLMITQRQLVKVLDFGLAKTVQPTSGDDFKTQASLTMAGMVVGTLNYMAPEQLRGGAVDHRADLFSLGVVLYEMLAGRLPFPGDSMTEVADRILNREPEALARFNYAVPSDVETIVRKALEKNPNFRYQSAREFYVDLGNARRRLSDVAHTANSGGWGPMDFADPASGLPMPTTEAKLRTVAVLSFANITGDAGDDWISQGIAETLTADLSKVREIIVIPREQIFDLQRSLSAGGRAIDERQSVELGRRLGARFVISGAYQRLKDRIRITAQAVEVPTNRTQATVKLDGSINDLFELQDKLLEELLQKALAHRIETTERIAIAGDGAGSLEAFEAYSRGMLNLRLATPESVDRAIALFERALEHDVNYVEAMVALGSALDLKGAFLSIPEMLESSLQWLQKAVATRPAFAEAHVRLGETLTDLNRMDEGIAEIIEGLRLGPENAEAHAILARAYWIGLGKVDEAIAHYQRAIAINPEAGYAQLQLALLHAAAGDLDAADRAARAAVVLQEQAMSGSKGMLVVGARARLGYVLYRRGQYDDAIREYLRELEFVRMSDHALRDRQTLELFQKLSAAHQRNGDQTSADAYFHRAVTAFDRRLSAGADDPFTRYYMAVLYAVRGDAALAAMHLAKPVAELPALTKWRVPLDPDFDTVRADPSIVALFP